MKCPLFHAGELAHEPEFNPSNDDCLKTGCGFWSSICNQCSSPAIAEELHWIADRLQAVANAITSQPKSGMKL